MANVTATWIAGSGNWFVPADWTEPNPAMPSSPFHTLPTSSNDVVVPGTVAGAPLTIVVDGSAAVGALNSIGSAVLNLTSGTLATGSGGTFKEIDVGSGANLMIVGKGITLTLGNATIAGGVRGPGTVHFSGGTYTLNAGAVIAAGGWTIDGADTVLNTDLSYGGTLLVNGASAQQIINLNGHVLTLSGTSTLAGTILGGGSIKNTGTASIGPATIGFNNQTGTLSAPVTLENSSSISQTGFILLNGMFLNDAAGTWTITADSVLSNISGSFVNHGTLADTAKGISEIDGGFTTDGTLTIASGAMLQLGSGTQTLTGTVGGTGTLAFVGNYNATIGPAATVSVTTVTTQSSGAGRETLTLGGDLTYGGILSLLDATGTVNLNGKTLTLSGVSTFATEAVMTGRVDITGSSTLTSGFFGFLPEGASLAANAVTFENAGTVSQTEGVGLNGTILNDANATWNFSSSSFVSGLSATFTNHGTLAVTTAEGLISGAFNSDGTVTIASGGVLALDAGTQTLTGTVSGAGTLQFTGSYNATIGPAATLTVAFLTLGDGNGGMVALGGNLSYGGTLRATDGTGFLNLAGNTLTLGGTSTFLGGGIYGGGQVKVSGTATIGGTGIGIGPAGVAAGTAATFEDAGTVSLNAGLSLDGTIQVDAAAMFNITAASTITNKGATFTNHGTLADTATGISEIDGAFNSDGAVTIASGATLQLGSGKQTLTGTVSGAGTLAFTGGYNATIGPAATLTVAALMIGNGTLGTVALGGDLSYGGTFGSVGASVVNLAGHMLTLGGTSTFSGGGVYGGGRVKVTGTATLNGLGIGVDLGGPDVAAVFEDAGTVSLGGIVGLDGTIQVDAGAMLTVTAGSTITNVAGATFTNSGTVNVTGAQASEIDGAFTSDGTVTIASGATLQLGSGKQMLTGTVSGAGTLSFVGSYNPTIGPAALTVANLVIGNGTGALGGDLSYGGTFSDTGGLGFVNLAGNTLTLGGTSTFLGGGVYGGGRVKVSGTATIGGTGIGIGPAGVAAGTAATFEDAGTVSLNAGLSLDGTIQVDAAAMFNITAASKIADRGATVTNHGTLADTATGVSEIDGAFTSDGAVTIASGATLQLGSGTQMLTGTVSGAGTLSFVGNVHATIGPAATLTVAALVIGDGRSGTVTLGGNLSYGGTFSTGIGSAFLNLAGNMLTLGGTSTFSSGGVYGSGRVKVTGTATINSLGIGTVSAGGDPGRASVFEDAGTVSLIGTVGLNGTIQVDAGAMLTITAGSKITNSGATFTNNGTVNVTGVASSEIDAAFTNTGVVAVTSSGLTLVGAVVNDGQLTVAGGALVVNGALTSDAAHAGTVTINGVASAELMGAVGPGEQVVFGSATGTLRLDAVAGFAGSIQGFAAGDVIDVTGVSVTAARFQQLTAGTGQIVLLNGTTQVGALNVTGNYVSSAIRVSADLAGGFDLAVTPKVAEDFNGDNQSDLLLQNSNGAIEVQTQANLAVTGTAPLGNPGPTWHVLSGADFNGDTTPDILLQNDNGSLVDFILNGTSITAGFNLGNPGSSWHVRGTGDFNADGRADLVMQNDNGSLVVLETNGTSLIGSAFIGTLPAGWAVEGVADFYGNGQPDLLVESGAGDLVIFTMAGTAITSSAVIGGPVPGFTVAGTGDYNGDGKADILLHNDNGANVLYEMNGATVTNAVLVGNSGPTFRSTITGVDLNGDGSSDLVVQDAGSNTIVGFTLDHTAGITLGAVLSTPAGFNIVGSNPMTFIDGTSTTLNLTATPGPDQFVFTSFAAGTHTISGFDPATDSIALTAPAIPTYVPFNGGTFIALSGTADIVLPNVTPSQLGAVNFVLR